ncbi:protein-tyrosine-phosphatase, partial [Mycobacterium sp. ITM-2017-0098]
TDSVLGVREEYLDVARRTVDSEFGSLAGYLEAAGIIDEDVRKPRKALDG